MTHDVGSILEATNPCEKSNGGCSHMCIFSDGSAQCLCAYSLLKPDGSCAGTPSSQWRGFLKKCSRCEFSVNPAFLAYSHSGIVDFVSLSTNTTVPRGSLRFPEIPRWARLLLCIPEQRQFHRTFTMHATCLILSHTKPGYYRVAHKYCYKIRKELGPY